MSWDLFVFSSKAPDLVDETGRAIFADDFEPPAIASRNDLKIVLSAAYTGIQWHDPAFGTVVDQDFSLEIALGRDDPVRTFTIFARGQATPAILHLIEGTGWHVLDTTTGKWLHLSEDADEGRRRFQEFLDHVVAQQKRPDAPPPKRRGLWSRLFRR